jgi:FkbM family methyltransferase
MIVQRVKTLLSRRRRAKQLGFSFHRVRDFEIPKSIRIFGKEVAISVPPQETMQGCFLEVLMDDQYGLKYLGRENISTIIDVGGNVGFFTLAAREVFPTATIHVYEPNPAVMPYLAVHAAASGSIVFNEAVGAVPGRVRLTEVDYVNVRSSLDTNGKIPQVAFRTALERIGGHCDLVKLDCEGAEWQMLADREPWRHVDHLRLEYHLWDTPYGHDKIVSVLAELNFEVSRQIPSDVFGVVWASRKR